MTDLSNISNTPTVTPSSNACCNDDGCGVDCVFSSSLNEKNQNGLMQTNTEDASPRRHNSMDQLMGIFNEMGKTSRTRSLSDGGGGGGPEEGKYI